MLGQARFLLVKFFMLLNLHARICGLPRWDYRRIAEMNALAGQRWGLESVTNCIKVAI